MNDKIDKQYMEMALKLARKGEGWVSPNPMVGAVIVKNGKILGKGYHQRFGQDHAEINAMADSLESVEGATLYVTLEPCSHYGKTPPCADSIIEKKLSRVVVGSLDPNPLVSGNGIGKLRDHGIETKVGVLEQDCEKLNEKFFKFMETGMPFVTIKYAQTIDGRIASSTGHSRWISSEPSRRFAHRLRAQHDAVLVGIGTIIADDPDLRVRMVRGKNPLRVVIDPALQMPQNANVLDNQDSSQTIICTGTLPESKEPQAIKDRGIETVAVERKGDGYLDLRSLLLELAKRQISSILVEGGAGVITSFLSADLFDRIIAITAPKIVGKGIEAVGDLGIRLMNDSIALRFERVFKKGDDIVMHLKRRKD